jgi:tight adherence protein C
VIQAETKGTPLREVLSIQATVMRQRHSFEAEERAAKATMKMMIPLVLLLAATFIIIIAPVMISAQSWM